MVKIRDSDHNRELWTYEIGARQGFPIRVWHGDGYRALARLCG